MITTCLVDVVEVATAGPSQVVDGEVKNAIHFVLGQHRCGSFGPETRFPDRKGQSSWQAVSSLITSQKNPS